MNTTCVKCTDTVPRDSQTLRQKLCAMLDISGQSSFREIETVYRQQREDLEQVTVCSAAEEALLNEKREALEAAFAAFQEAGTEETVVTLLPGAYEQARKAKETRLYSFNIPCIFAGTAHVVNCVYNWTCADCSCCYCEEDMCVDCYQNDCDALVKADTFIAVIAIGYGVFRLLAWLWTEYSYRLGVKQLEREQRKMRSYLQSVNTLYIEFEKMEKSALPVDNLFSTLDRISAGKETEQQYAGLKEDIARYKDELQQEWKTFLKRRSSLQNNAMYRYLPKTASEPYVEEFRRELSSYKMELLLDMFHWTPPQL